MLAFLDAAQLDRVGCFAYSPVDGAAANALPDPVADDVKEDRRARFMAMADQTHGSSLVLPLRVLLSYLEIEDNLRYSRHGAPGIHRKTTRSQRRRLFFPAFVALPDQPATCTPVFR